MSYLKDFLTQISNQNFNKFLTLWEEYCMSDEVDADELIQLFEAIKNSKLAKKFGEIAESALPLWQMVENEEKSYIILKLI